MAHRTEYPPDATLRWTDRQRQVLDLLARGRSNAEIADDLGVSLAGAKWHVSEVISKLGVESREEVAAYWRERQSLRARSRRAMHGLLGLLSLKVLAGAGAVAGLGMVGIAALTLGAGPDEDRPLAVEATLTPTATGVPMPTLAGFVPEVSAPDWWEPLGDIPSPDDAPGQILCQTGWDAAVGFALLEVPGNEYYFVMTPATSTNAGREIACVRHAGRLSYVWDSAGNLVTDFDGRSGGGGTFAADADAPPSCSMSRAPRSPSLQEPEVTLHLDCSVPLSVAYAVVDDGTPDRVQAIDMPSILNIQRKAIVAGHRTYGTIVIEFFEADGTLVDRQEHSSPG